MPCVSTQTENEWSCLSHCLWTGGNDDRGRVSRCPACDPWSHMLVRGRRLKESSWLWCTATYSKWVATLLALRDKKQIGCVVHWQLRCVDESKAWWGWQFPYPAFKWEVFSITCTRVGRHGLLIVCLAMGLWTTPLFKHRAACFSNIVGVKLRSVDK